MKDEELKALTALVEFERAEWEYGAQRYGEAQFDPNTPTRRALYAELDNRGITSSTAMENLPALGGNL